MQYMYVNNSLSWLKRRLSLLGLHRKGHQVVWDSYSLVKECVKVRLLDKYMIMNMLASRRQLHSHGIDGS